MFISRAVYAFCGDMEPFDDMAALVLMRDEPTGKWQLFPIALSALDEVKTAVFAAAGETPQARKAVLACDELIANIVNYSRATTLQYSCRRLGDELRIAFSDDGIPFDPTAADIEDKDFDMLDMGGMSLGMIRQSASSIQYRREDARNLSLLTFSLIDA